jgi:sulfite exporter TauE/SafE/copper chaperone CopZ
MSKHKIIIPIRGMHCRSCEVLIEDKLVEIPGVEKVNSNWKKGEAEIFYEKKRPDNREIDEAIRDAGYSIGRSDKKYLLSSNPSDYKDLGVAALFLLGIYLILKNFGLMNIDFGAGGGSDTSIPVVFLIGITAGLSTCMALVGGLVLGLSTRHAEKHPEATPGEKFRPHLFFNLGRILFFMIAGGILGSLGSVFQLSSFTLGVITIFVGIVMLVMGLQLIEIFPILNGLKLTLPKGIARILGIKNNQKEYSHRGSMLLGAFTFFLPCGFTQAMQLYAISTGNFVAGALIMGTFALGTAPGLLGIGGLTSVVKGIFAKRFFKFAGLLIIFFSMFNITNGYNLTGWQSKSGLDKSVLTDVNDPNVKIENGVQVVRMKEISRGYSPNQFTIQKGIPVKWIITAEALNSCAASLVVPKMNIQKRLVAGENVIEFTPKETGALKFSCAMGMYTGIFNVVDENGNGGSIQSDNSAASGTGTCGAGGGGGGCGGCGGGGNPVQPSEGKVEQNTSEQSATGNEQVLKTTYTLNEDIQPNTFTVKVNTPVKFVVDVKESGQGCMSTIMIPGLYNSAVYLEKGQLIEMSFTPTKKGEYQITCAMGVPRGVIKVN